jgi:hypothetical protein
MLHHHNVDIDIAEVTEEQQPSEDVRSRLGPRLGTQHGSCKSGRLPIVR